MIETEKGCHRDIQQENLSNHLGKVLEGRKGWSEEQIIKHLKGKVNYEEKIFSKC